MSPSTRNPSSIRNSSHLGRSRASLQICENLASTSCIPCFVARGRKTEQRRRDSFLPELMTFHLSLPRPRTPASALALLPIQWANKITLELIFNLRPFSSNSPNHHFINHSSDYMIPWSETLPVFPLVHHEHTHPAVRAPVNPEVGLPALPPRLLPDQPESQPVSEAHFHCHLLQDGLLKPQTGDALSVLSRLCPGT